ncbi:MAG: shikimate kinase AroK [Pseudomonadota bacterium]
MLPPQKIVLVGPMGAGKSTIGRLLSKQLELPFIDSDSVIEDRCGANISWIFDVEGEEGFRQRETHILEELLKEKSLVLATGGGVVLKSENRQLLKQADVVVYLFATIEHLIQRTKQDKQRPLLQVANAEERIRTLLEQRDPLYREVATRIVTTDTRSPRIVAKEIAENLKGSSKN